MGEGPPPQNLLAPRRNLSESGKREVFSKGRRMQTPQAKEDSGGRRLREPPHAPSVPQQADRWCDSTVLGLLSLPRAGFHEEHHPAPSPPARCRPTPALPPAPPAHQAPRSLLCSPHLPTSTHGCLPLVVSTQSGSGSTSPGLQPFSFQRFLSPHPLCWSTSHQVPPAGFAFFTYRLCSGMERPSMEHPSVPAFSASQIPIDSLLNSET